MSVFSRVFAITAVSITFLWAVCGNVQPICPKIQVNTGSQIDHSSLEPSCLAINMALNVENILPDPSYILPESNYDIINNALTKTLNDNQITGFSITNGISSINENWSINNDQYTQQCPDNKDNTVNKFNFQTAPYNMICENNALAVFQDKQTIECQFIMPKSAVYIWNLQAIESLIDIINIDQCEAATLQAIIGEVLLYQGAHNPNAPWEVLAISNIITVTQATSGVQQKFVFNTNNPIIFKPDTIYSVIISVKNCVSLISVTSNPVILTYQKPSPCQLGTILAVNNAMRFGLEALCNSSNSVDTTRKRLEDIFYQQHSSQTLVENYLQLGTVRRRLLTDDNNMATPFSAAIPSTEYTNPMGHNRQLLEDRPTPSPSPSGCGSCPTSTPSRRRLLQFQPEAYKGFHVTITNGSEYALGPEIIFPCIGQCIAIDSNTERIFSVGGQENGQAVDWLKVYQIKSQQHIEQVGVDLKLDKPRYGAMCFYYKSVQNGREYIIVMNGMNSVSDMDNGNVWYNDIAFIPLNPSENANMAMGVNGFPKVGLKHNVIDMKPYVTNANELWLFGGRDGFDAKNYIQVVDINQIFDGYEESFSQRIGLTVDNGGNEQMFVTMDRMEVMALDLVIPFVDFVKLNDKTCIMILGGQDYVNNEWVNIDIPLNVLQLYCNKIMNDKIDIPTANIVQFTEFDKRFLEKVDNFAVNDGLNNIFMTEYEFMNNDIWYEFSVSMKVCFDNDKAEYFMQAYDMFNNKQLMGKTNAVLVENILAESQREFNGWNYGFGNVYIPNIEVISNDCHLKSFHQVQCLQLTLPSGDQKCGYNTLNGDCYLTRRALLIEDTLKENENTGNVHSYAMMVVLLLIIVNGLQN